MRVRALVATLGGLAAVAACGGGARPAPAPAPAQGPASPPPLACVERYAPDQRQPPEPALRARLDAWLAGIRRGERPRVDHEAAERILAAADRQDPQVPPPDFTDEVAALLARVPCAEVRWHEEPDRFAVQPPFDDDPPAHQDLADRAAADLAGATHVVLLCDACAVAAVALDADLRVLAWADLEAARP